MCMAVWFCLKGGREDTTLIESCDKVLEGDVQRILSAHNRGGGQ